MSYNQGINQFIPNYVVKSDYLPSKVVEGNNTQTAELLRQYEDQKRRGRVFTQRPVDFQPNRYTSVKVSEVVRVDRPLDEQHFSRIHYILILLNHQLLHIQSDAQRMLFVVVRTFSIILKFFFLLIDSC